MSDGAGFHVVAADLQAHATTVDAVADEIRTAAQAAQAIEFDANAYGEFCQALPAMMSPLKGVIYQALDGATEAFRDTGARLRTAAGNYHGSDTATAQRCGQPS
jgi:hypothetical protein